MRTQLLAGFLLLACSWASPRSEGNDETAAKRRVVLIKSFRYENDYITVNVGETVAWRNADTVPHTVTAREKSFDSGSIAPGATWRFVAKSPGTYRYTCTFHPNMKATLVVR
jgi:plastocyanin